MTTEIRWWDSAPAEADPAEQPATLPSPATGPGPTGRVRPPDPAATVAPAAHGPGARLDYWLAGVPVVAAALWVAGFRGADPQAMTGRIDRVLGRLRVDVPSPMS